MSFTIDAIVKDIRNNFDTPSWINESTPYLAVKNKVFDPSGHGRIVGHYFHTGSPSVRPSVHPKNKNALQR